MISTFSNLSVSNNLGNGILRHTDCFFRAELLSSLKVSVFGKMIGVIFSFLLIHSTKLLAQQNVIVEQSQTIDNKHQTVINIQPSQVNGKEEVNENDWKIISLIVFLIVFCLVLIVIGIIYYHDKQKGYELIMKILDVIQTFFSRT